MTTQPVLTAYHTLLGRGVNEDDLHEAVVEIIPHLPDINHVLAYLARIAFRKRLKREQTQFSGSRGLYDCAAPEHELGRQESNFFVRRAVEQLPARERSIVQLYYFDGESRHAIARRLDCSLNVVGNLLFQARKRLRLSLACLAEAD